MKKSIFLISSLMFCAFFLLKNSDGAQTPSNSSNTDTSSSNIIRVQEPFNPILPMGNIKTVSSHFGNRIDPFTGLWESHQGVDYPAVTGTPILAIANGTVTQAGYNGGYGNLVEIDHGQGYTSKYGHASQILTRMGQQVQKGQVIALVGSTGHSTGPHLHFEMAQYGQVFNPMAFLNQGLQLGTMASNNQNSGGWNKLNAYPSGQKNTKAFFSTGEMIVAVRVRSGKPVKW